MFLSSTRFSFFLSSIDIFFRRQMFSIFMPDFIFFSPFLSSLFAIDMMPAFRHFFFFDAFLSLSPFDFDFFFFFFYAAADAARLR